MKFKVGDKVVRTEWCADDYTVKQGSEYVISKVDEYNNIYLQGVYDNNGQPDRFNPDNLGLVKEYESKPKPKFKKGDKVKCIEFTYAIGVEIGGIYTIENPKRTFYVDSKSIYVDLEGIKSTPNENIFELYEQEDKNYRHLSPDKLIPISIDGVESEVPLGDLVHAQALLGTTDGFYGGRMWEAIKDVIDPKMYISFNYSNVQKLEEQKLLFSKYFIDPKKEQQKEDIKKTILAKETELKLLQSQLKELD